MPNGLAIGGNAVNGIALNGNLINGMAKNGLYIYTKDSGTLPDDGYVYCGVRIDNNISHVDNRVTYINLNGQMLSTPPVVELTELIGGIIRVNKDMFNYQGTNFNSDVTVGDVILPDIGRGSNSTGVDTMMRIPKMGYQIINRGGGITEIFVTNNPNAQEMGFRYHAHSRITEGDRKYLYVACYLSGQNNISSRAMVAIVNNLAASRTFIQMNTDARARGFTPSAQLTGENRFGYDPLYYFPLQLLQCLYVLIYKSTGIDAGGGGFRGSANAPNTGSTDFMSVASPDNLARPNVDASRGGLFYGNGNAAPSKFLGIEDFIGNSDIFIGGGHYNNGGNRTVRVYYNNQPTTLAAMNSKQNIIATQSDLGITGHVADIVGGDVGFQIRTQAPTGNDTFWQSQAGYTTTREGLLTRGRLTGFISHFWGQRTHATAVIRTAIRLMFL